MTKTLITTHGNPGPMDAMPGQAEYVLPADAKAKPHPLYCQRCGFTHARPSETGCMGHERAARLEAAALTPEEAEVAAACVAAMLEDYDKLDPAYPLLVWHNAAPGPTPVLGPARRLDGAATDASVAAARSALAKLREVVSA